VARGEFAVADLAADHLGDVLVGAHTVTVPRESELPQAGSDVLAHSLRLC
jgi:hypothetical protein